MATLQLSLQKSGAERAMEPSRQHSIRSLFDRGRTEASRLPLSRADAASGMDFLTGANFTHLRLTAEKMVQEQASARTELQILRTKLQKSEDEIQHLDSRLRTVQLENAKLKVKQEEDEKLWKGLDAKDLARRTMLEQMMETFGHIEQQVEQGENACEALQRKLEDRLKFYEETNEHFGCLKANYENTATHLAETEANLRLEKQEAERYAAKAEEENARLRDCLDSKSKELITLQEKLDTAADQALVDAEQLRAEKELVIQENTELRNQLKLKEEAFTAARDAAESEKASIWQQLKLKEEESQEHIKRICQTNNEAIAALQDRYQVKEARFNDAMKRLQQDKDLAEGAAMSAEKEKAELRSQLELKDADLQRATRAAKEADEKSATLKGHLAFKNKELIALQQDFDTAAAQALMGEEQLRAEKELVKQENADLQSQLKQKEEAFAAACITAESEKASICLQLKLKEDEYQEDVKKLCETKDQAIAALQDKYEVEEARINQVMKKLQQDKDLAESAAISVEKEKAELRSQLESKDTDLQRHLKDICQRNDQEIAVLRKKYETEEGSFIQSRERLQQEIAVLQKKYETEEARFSQSRKRLQMEKEEAESKAKSAEARAQSRERLQMEKDEAEKKAKSAEARAQSRERLQLEKEEAENKAKSSEARAPDVKKSTRRKRGRPSKNADKKDMPAMTDLFGAGSLDPYDDDPYAF